jgi:hypothetical protein
MAVCNECRAGILEKMDEWLFMGYEGGLIGTSGHWAEEERKRCEPFILHWAIDYDPGADWAEEDDEQG